MQLDRNDPTRILELPLVVVAGVTGETLSITVLMHEGYDRLNLDVARIWPRWKDLEADATHLVAGSRANPAFSWPVYVRVEQLEAA